MSNRLLSSIIVLLIFGGGFLAVTAAVNWFAYADAIVDHEFSFERRTADLHFEENNYPAAARYYGQLAQKDPDNGGAKFLHAWSLALPREEFLTRIERELQSPAPDQTVSDEAPLELNRISVEAIEAFKQVLEFPQFRSLARLQLAKMYAMAGESETAIDYLAAALEENVKHRQPISAYVEFRPLLENAQFQELVRLRQRERQRQ